MWRSGCLSFIRVFSLRAPLVEVWWWGLLPCRSRSLVKGYLHFQWEGNVEVHSAHKKTFWIYSASSLNGRIIFRLRWFPPLTVTNPRKTCPDLSPKQIAWEKVCKVSTKQLKTNVTFFSVLIFREKHHFVDLRFQQTNRVLRSSLLIQQDAV